MRLDALRFASVMLTAVAVAAGLAHLFALPNKLPLGAEEYLIAQQIYRGWALLGIPIFAALGTTLALVWLERRRPRVFGLTLAAALCIAAALVVFFLFTFPANRRTANWTFLPEDWQSLRRQWEFSHAVGALLYVGALKALTLSLLAGRR